MARLEAGAVARRGPAELSIEPGRLIPAFQPSAQWPKIRSIATAPAWTTGRICLR